MYFRYIKKRKKDRDDRDDREAEVYRKLDRQTKINGQRHEDREL